MLAPLCPHVRWTHPNYAMVLLGETIVHAGLCCAAMFGAHTSPSWYYLTQAHGVALIGYLHGLIAVTMILGAYWRWPLMRLALLASVSLYSYQTALLTAGVIRSYVDPLVAEASLETTFYGLGLILLSIAAYREPLIPGRYRDRDARQTSHSRERPT